MSASSTEGRSLFAIVCLSPSAAYGDHPATVQGSTVPAQFGQDSTTGPSGADSNQAALPGEIAAR